MDEVLKSIHCHILIAHIGGNPSGYECLRTFKELNPDGKAILFTRMSAIPIEQLPGLKLANAVFRRPDDHSKAFANDDEVLDLIASVRREPAVVPPSSIPVKRLTVDRLVRSMTPGQLWGVLVAVATLVTGSYELGSWQARSTVTAALRPSPPTEQPRISLGDLRDEQQHPIDKQAAPFQVLATGTVSNADGLFTCLVVEAQHTERVQPGCRKAVGSRFDGAFYLGEDSNKESLNKPYKAFAVLSKTAFNAYEVLDRNQLVVMSDPVMLHRTH